MSSAREPVLVGGREVSTAAIAAEVQHHPAPNADAAWAAAAKALVVRQLLLDEADRLAIGSADVYDAAGQRMTDDDARVDALLAREIRIPQADEQTCRRFHDRNPQRFVSPTLVEAGHILLAASAADERAMRTAMADARALIRRIQADPDCFAALAREHSACPSREQGGNLGQVGHGQMVLPFEQALFALPEHALSPDPVSTRIGVHVIRSGRRVEGGPLPFEAVREAIAGYLEEASYRRAVAQFIGILAGRAGVSGVHLAAADGPLVQ